VAVAVVGGGGERIREEEEGWRKYEKRGGEVREGGYVDSESIFSFIR
jgi:hypothetical protein